MKHRLQKIFALSFLLAGALFGAEISAQTNVDASVRRNSPFAPNPKRKAEIVKQNSSVAERETLPAQNAEEKFVETANEENPEPEFEKQTIAGKTIEIARKRAVLSTAPTEIYRVGAGDVLDIKILNSPAKNSTLFTVLANGTIDYPLAGEPVTVEDLTPEEIENLLAEKVKLYENPEITVSVRDFAARKISVLGLVERPGTKALRRVAIPLYAILAEAIPLSSAEKVTILRGADKQTITVGLEDDETLVYADDIIRVVAEDAKNSLNRTKFYFIGGSVVSGGQKDFHEGITLTQAILASGGLKKSSTRKATIRRRNSEGLLESKDFDLKTIKDGKLADPQLQAGDLIEIDN
jgi:protein involved in polysaccharide export with SLBB domain